MPPVALTVTVELPPLHRIGVLEELGFNALGWVILPVVVAVQLLCIGHRVGVSPRRNAERARAL